MKGLRYNTPSESRYFAATFEKSRFAPQIQLCHPKNPYVGQYGNITFATQT